MRVWRGSLRAGDTAVLDRQTVQIVDVQKRSMGCLAQSNTNGAIGRCLVDAEAQLLTPQPLVRRIRLKARMALVDSRRWVVDRLFENNHPKAARIVQETAWRLHDLEIGLRAIKPW